MIILEMETSNEKRHKFTPYLILLSGIIIFIISNGRWSVPFAAWIAPVFLIRFLDQKKPLAGLTILFILMTIATRIMLYGIIPSLLGILTYILTVYYALLWFLPYLAHRLVSKKIHGFKSTLVFPITAVTFEFINNLMYGSWASFAYTQFDNLPLIQISSVLGIWGITFLVTWFPIVIIWMIDHKFEWSVIKKGTITFVVTISLVMLYGGIRLEVFPPQSDTVTIASFTASKETGKYYEQLEKLGYTSSIEMAKKDRLTQSKLFKNVYDEVFETNAKLISPDVSITFWPEGLIKVLEEDEDAFLAQGQQWAAAQNIYLLMAYFVIQKLTRKG